MKRKLISLLLVLTMVISILPVTSLAADPEYVDAYIFGLEYSSVSVKYKDGAVIKPENSLYDHTDEHHGLWRIYKIIKGSDIEITYTPDDGCIFYTYTPDWEIDEYFTEYTVKETVTDVFFYEPDFYCYYITSDSSFVTELTNYPMKAKVDPKDAEDTISDYALAFGFENHFNFYFEGWNLDIVFTFDTAIDADKLIMFYGGYDVDHSTDVKAKKVTSSIADGEEISIYELFEVGDVTCLNFNHTSLGFKHLEGAEVKGTVKLIVTNGERTSVIAERQIGYAASVDFTDGTKNYYSVQEAVNAVDTGPNAATPRTVILLRDVLIDNYIFVQNTKYLKLDLNNHLLKSTKYRGQVIDNDGYLIVDDSTAEDDKVKHYYLDNNCPHNSLLCSYCEYCPDCVAAADGVYETEVSEGDVVGLKQGEYLVIKGGQITTVENNINYNYNLVVNYGTFVLNGGNICGSKNQLGDENWGLYAAVWLDSSSTFIMNGGEICNNQILSHYGYGDQYGGGVAVANGATFTMTGGIIHNNYCTNAGGVYNCGNMTITGDAQIINNSAIKYAGVIDDAHFDVEISSVIGGSAQIADNYTLTGDEQNYAFYDGFTVGTGENAPDGMNVGLTKLGYDSTNHVYYVDEGNFAAAADASAKNFFFADSKYYEIEFATDHLEINKKPVCYKGDDPSDTRSSLDELLNDTEPLGSEAEPLKITLIGDVEEDFIIYASNAAGEPTGDSGNCHYIELDLNDHVIKGIRKHYADDETTSTAIYNYEYLKITDSTPEAEKTTRYFLDLYCEHSVLIGTPCTYCAECKHGVKSGLECDECYNETGYYYADAEDTRLGIASSDGFFETLASDDYTPVGEEGVDYISVKGGIITGSDFSAIFNEGTLELSSGNIAGNTAGNLSIYLNGRDNRDYGYGGGLFNRGDFIMTGGRIVNNMAFQKSYFQNSYSYDSYGNGGGIYNCGNITIEDGAIEYNVSYGYNSYAGAIYNDYNLTIKGGSINNNTADYGGGVFSYYGDMDFSAGEISENTATFNGGGVYFGCYSSSDITFKMTGTAKITDNTAGWYGAGINTNTYGNILLLGGEISGNKVENKLGKGTFGGVAYWEESNPITIGGDIKIINNTYNGKASNLCKYPDATITISEDTPLKQGAEIGLSYLIDGVKDETFENDVCTFISGAKEDMLGYFKSDFEDIKVVFTDGEEDDTIDLEWRGVWKIIDTDNTDYYPTLQAAADAADEDENIVLVHNTDSANNNASISKKLTLILNGKEFTGKITASEGYGIVDSEIKADTIIYNVAEMEIVDDDKDDDDDDEFLHDSGGKLANIIKAIFGFESVKYFSFGEFLERLVEHFLDIFR